LYFPVSERFDAPSQSETMSNQLSLFAFACCFVYKLQKTEGEGVEQLLKKILFSQNCWKKNRAREATGKKIEHLPSTNLGLVSGRSPIVFATGKP